MNKFAKIALTATISFVLASTINSCASKPATPTQDDSELREKKAEMMRELDESR